MLNGLLTPEFYVTPGAWFLCVHKCATATVQESIGAHFNFCGEPQPETVVWTCYRDPVDRFKSGLYYDLCISGLGEAHLGDTEGFFRRVLEDRNTYKVFKSVDERKKATGKIPHTIAQSAYWLSARIDTFVPIEELDHFLMLHYGRSKVSNELARDENYWRFMKIASEYDEKIADAHELDYKLISGIQPWRWEYGKVF